MYISMSFFFFCCTVCIFHFLQEVKCTDHILLHPRSRPVFRAGNTVHLIMLPYFVLEQDGCQLDASWMSRLSRKWAPVRWKRSDRAPPHSKMGALC